MHEYLTVLQFSKVINVHPNTVRLAIKFGHINAFRAGPGKKSPFRIPITEFNRLKLLGCKENNSHFIGMFTHGVIEEIELKENF